MERRHVCLLLLATVWQLGGNAHASSPDSLYQVAVKLINAVPIQESIHAFKEVLKVERKHGPSHHELAKLYLSQNTLQARESARFSLDKALRLEPDNLEYMVTLGDLMGAQGLWYNASRLFEGLADDHPDQAHAAYKAGYYALQDFLKYMDMIHIEVTRAQGGASSNPVYLEEFAARARHKAVTYLQKSIEADPKLREPYYHLGLLHFESGNPKGLIDLARSLLNHVPNDKDALLFLGLGYQTLGDQETAYAFYTRALARMNPEERAAMESVDIIATREERTYVASTDSLGATGDGEQRWSDSHARSRFWRKRDPLFLTEFNERRMEHYGRMAYADLAFSRISKGIAGWRTDRGRAFIKFGRWPKRIAQRPEVDERGRLVRAHLETWFYEGFTISFRNWDGLDAWRFDTTYRPGSTQPTGGYVFSKTAPRYVDPYRRRKYSLPHLIAAFRDGGRFRVEVSYVVPKRKVRTGGAGETVDLDNGIFVFDRDWNEVIRKRSRLEDEKWPGTDSLTAAYLLCNYATHLGPGQYRIVVETMDRASKSIGTFSEERMFGPADRDLALSDLLLASEIKVLRDFPESRFDLHITPNPHRTYRKAERVFLYLEMYNLRLDGFGRTRYELSYRIAPRDIDDVDPRLFLPVDLQLGPVRLVIESPALLDAPSGTQIETGPRVRYLLPDNRKSLKELLLQPDPDGTGTARTITVEYDGNRTNDFTYLGIDVSELSFGIYSLTVALRDATTGEIVEKETLLRISEMPEAKQG